MTRSPHQFLSAGSILSTQKVVSASAARQSPVVKSIVENPITIRIIFFIFADYVFS